LATVDLDLGTSTNDSPKLDGINAEDVKALFDQLREKQNRVIKTLWFVDRHPEYMQLRDSIQDQGTITDPRPIYALTSLYGIVVNEIDTHFPVSDKSPWFARVSGIWAEFTDGSVELVGV